MFLMVQSMGKEHFRTISELDWALQTAIALKPSAGLEIKELESRDVERGDQGCATEPNDKGITTQRRLAHTLY